MAVERDQVAPRHRAPAAEAPLPSALRIGLSRVVPELKMF